AGDGPSGWCRPTPAPQGDTPIGEPPRARHSTSQADVFGDLPASIPSDTNRWLGPSPRYSPAGTGCGTVPVIAGPPLRGRLAVNPPPPAGWLSASVCPPCRCPFSPAIARPRPPPPDRARPAASLRQPSSASPVAA